MSKYDQKALEKKWQKKWHEMELYHFDFDSDKKPYSIDVPPRYASGPLHAGHAVHYTHIDFAARYKRMRGYNVFFPLCFDVNGIPIEERVERQLNITRKDIDRHKFTKLCSEFAEKNIKTMTYQFMILGESMDPSIYYQTNAEYYRRLTQISFIELFNKGYIYKGEFPVNWCPRCMTAMADAEVTYTDRTTKLNTIKFYFKDQPSEQVLKFHGIDKDKKGVYVPVSLKLIRQGTPGFEFGYPWQMLDSAHRLETRPDVYVVIYIQHSGKDQATRYFFTEERARDYIRALSRVIVEQQNVREVDVHHENGKRNLFSLLDNIPVNTYTSFQTNTDTFSITLGKVN